MQILYIGGPVACFISKKIIFRRKRSALQSIACGHSSSRRRCRAANRKKTVCGAAAPAALPPPPEPSARDSEVGKAMIELELVHGFANSLPTSVDKMRVAVLKRLAMSSVLKKDKPFIRAMRQAMQNETTADELNAVLGSDQDSE
eukprot:scaffold9419_cov120-Isochrysis_galbana.AAC.1